jgi:hypothetical protein
MPYVCQNFQMLLPSSVETFHLHVKATGKNGLNGNINNFYMGYDLTNMFIDMKLSQFLFLGSK